MPNRIIKESICTSDTVDQLTWFEEVLFYRLIVNCDDYGRFDGRPAVVKNRLFPLKDNLTLKNVEAAINKLARVGLIAPYSYGGKPFLYLPTWNEHQTVRAKRSRFPDPEIICNHLQADASICPRNPIQSNPIQSLSESQSNRVRVREEAFAAFWAAYPRHEKQESAREAFEKCSEPLEVLLDALEAQKKSAQWRRANGRYIPHADKWLREKRWTDTLTAGDDIPQGASGSLGEAELSAIRAVLDRDLPEE